MFRKSLSIDEKLSLELGTPSAYRDVMISCANNVLILSKQEEYKEALLFAKRALAIGEALAEQLDTDAARREAEVMRSTLKIVEAYCKKS